MLGSLFLNEDIRVEILGWLPAKEIARLRCVCKQWLTLASDPCFIRCHSARNPHPSTSGFFLRDHIYRTDYFPLNVSPPGIPDPSLSFIPGSTDVDPISIQSSCNGLIICARINRSDFLKSIYYVCNPTTREFIPLPLPPNVRHYYFSLAFDPSNSPHYNVVCTGFEIHVYSSQTRSWSLSVDKETLREYGRLRFYHSVFWNGALIWVADACLRSFNVGGEYLKKLPLPSEPHGCSRVEYIGESRGKLQMVGRAKNERFSTVLDIFEMDLQCSGWSVLYHVDLDPIKELYPEIQQIRRVCVSGARMGYGGRNPRMPKAARGYLACSPVCFIRGGESCEGEEEAGVLLLSLPRKIISYHLRTKVFEKVCDVSTSESCGWYKFFPFGHTLMHP